jgi:SAM-dependent methyltransferase
MAHTEEACPICRNISRPLDVVDFNKSCIEAEGKALPLIGVPVYYFLCDTCGFCFAPDLYKWSKNEFSEKIYNDDYVVVDPDYVSKRPIINAKNMEHFFGRAEGLKHLDYGGGSGLTSELLRDRGWDSRSYDPFDDRNTNLNALGKFEIVSAFEVFEHVPDPKSLIRNLSNLLAPEGVVIFSTLLSDGQIARNTRLSWWYAGPRNGHISLFSHDSLTRLTAQERLSLGSFSSGMHMAWRPRVPDWAQHLMRAPEAPVPQAKPSGFLSKLLSRNKS